MAKWPGTQLYFKAVVKEISEADQSVEVLFEDGTEMEVPFDFIKVSLLS